MAVLIPFIGSCTFDSGGERRLAVSMVEAKRSNLSYTRSIKSYDW